MNIFLLRSEAFSFKLFGIFVNISNEIPPLHKAGATLATSKKQNREKHETCQTHHLYFYRVISIKLFAQKEYL
ncbi:hypothetical protein FEDK69T_30860 [Flavobacterium enshiense DK69]|nr:hypothetical protein FEDK69T_30860 [Flavobacterium enshiense DK69]